MKLTDGENDQGPVCSPDQKWLYYYAGDSIYRVLADGSAKPEEVKGSTPPRQSSFMIFVDPMSISPNGETLACMWVDLKPPGGVKVVLVNLETQASPRLLDVHSNIVGTLRFTPDAKSVAYVINEHGATNIWVQPIDGSPGRQITNFHSADLEDFRWSPDGKNLGILRKKTESDVVVLKETKSPS